QKNTAAKPVIKETLPTIPQPTITVSENPATAKLNYSQPLDEIKEMYVKTLNERKQKIARKGFWLQSMKKAALLLFLIAIGVIAGFMLKSNSHKEQPSVKSSEALSAKSTTPVTTQQDTVTTPGIQSLRAPSGGFANKEVLEEKKTAETKQAITKAPNI